MGQREHYVSGIIAGLNIKGVGPNSAQLFFTMVDQNTDAEVSLVAYAQQEQEQQVFSALASFLTNAYFSDMPITVGYSKFPGETARVVEVFAPTKDPDSE